MATPPNIWMHMRAAWSDRCSGGFDVCLSLDSISPQLKALQWRPIILKQWFSNLSVHRNSRGLVKHRTLGPTPRVSPIGRHPRIHISPGFQIMLMLLVQVLHSKNHWFEGVSREWQRVTKSPWWTRPLPFSPGLCSVILPLDMKLQQHQSACSSSKVLHTFVPPCFDAFATSLAEFPSLPYLPHESACSFFNTQLPLTTSLFPEGS